MMTNNAFEVKTVLMGDSGIHINATTYINININTK